MNSESFPAAPQTRNNPKPENPISNVSISRGRHTLRASPLMMMMMMIMVVVVVVVVLMMTTAANIACVHGWHSQTHAARAHSVNQSLSLSHTHSGTQTHSIFSHSAASGYLNPHTLLLPSQGCSSECNHRLVLQHTSKLPSECSPRISNCASAALITSTRSSNCVGNEDRWQLVFQDTQALTKVTNEATKVVAVVAANK